MLFRLLLLLLFVLFSCLLFFLLQVPLMFLDNIFSCVLMYTLAQTLRFRRCSCSCYSLKPTCPFEVTRYDTRQTLCDAMRQCSA